MRFVNSYRSKSILVAAMVAVIVSLVVAGTAQADDWQEKDKLTALDGAGNDLFGYSVSISGDYAIVGAYNDDPCGTDSGSAYIFTRDGESWVQQTMLTGRDISSGAFFGTSVSISGDYAIVGAYKGFGSAYIFKRFGENWIEQAKLLPSDGAAADFFGCSVSISGDYAIVGASQADVNGLYNSGSAYIFEMPKSGWVDAIETAKLTVSDGAVRDRFGVSVSVWGDYAIVGAYTDDPCGTDSGSAYIFAPNEVDSNWSQQAKLTASDGAGGDRFGASVSVWGDYAIVGAHKDDPCGIDSGSAYIFKRDGESWIQQTMLTGRDIADGDRFGVFVSISGDYAIVGADFGEDNAVGSAHIFKRNDDADWTQEDKLTASDGETFDQFGVSVAIDGENAIVGAHNDDQFGINSGSAYVFQKAICPTGDFNGSCGVDFVDYSIFALAWLTKEGQDGYNPNCNISIPAYDSIDWMDFIVFTDNWLIGTQ